jgi:hypothetical protein
MDAHVEVQEEAAGCIGGEDRQNDQRPLQVDVVKAARVHQQDAESTWDAKIATSSVTINVREKAILIPARLPAWRRACLPLGRTAQDKSDNLTLENSAPPVTDELGIVMAQWLLMEGHLRKRSSSTYDLACPRQTINPVDPHLQATDRATVRADGEGGARGRQPIRRLGPKPGEQP